MNGSCGEVMCAHLYFSAHPGSETIPQGARFAAVKKENKKDCVMKPCGGGDTGEVGFAFEFITYSKRQG
jgi:hypothetical protein